MTTIVLVIHLLIALALVGLILLQRNEGGGLGMGGGGGTMGGLMTTRGSANLLTRSTAILAVAFVATSMTLAILGARSQQGTSVLDTVAPPAPLEAPVGTAPVQPAPAEPVQPAAPAAPAAPVVQ